MPKQLIIVRHGSTNHNKKHILQGWLDTKLDEDGKKQAELVAQRLSKISFDYIYSSDLQRAEATAQRISSLTSKPLISTPQLRESNFGILQGHRWDNIPKHLRNIWREFEYSFNKARDLHWKKHKGESLHEIYERINGFMHMLKTRHSNESIVIVSHGGTINYILRLLKLIKQSDFVKLKNTSVTILEKHTTEVYKIKLLNDTSHIE